MMDNVELFKIMISEWMLNTSDYLDNEYLIVVNRVSFNHLTASDYYDLLVTETRQDYARHIFRQIRQLIDSYL